jgi:hypothetical protein
MCPGHELGRCFSISWHGELTGSQIHAAIVGK